MQDIDRINAVLWELGARHDIPELRLGSEGSVCLRLADGIELTLEYVSRHQQLFACYPLMPLPPDDKACARLFRAMLELNCLELGTGYGTLVIDKAGNRVLCQTALPVAGLHLDGLDHVLQTLVAQKDSIVRVLDGDREPAVPQSGPAPARNQPPSSLQHLMHRHAI